MRSSSTLGRHIQQHSPLEKGKACSTCKARKVRCDASVPACKACRRTARFEGRDESLVVCCYNGKPCSSNQDRRGLSKRRKVRKDKAKEGADVQQVVDAAPIGPAFNLPPLDTFLANTTLQSTTYARAGSTSSDFSTSSTTSTSTSTSTSTLSTRSSADNIAWGSSILLPDLSTSTYVGYPFSESPLSTLDSSSYFDAIHHHTPSSESSSGSGSGSDSASAFSFPSQSTLYPDLYPSSIPQSFDLPPLYLQSLPPATTTMKDPSYFDLPLPLASTFDPLELDWSIPIPQDIASWGMSTPAWNVDF